MVMSSCSTHNYTKFDVKSDHQLYKHKFNKRQIEDTNFNFVPVFLVFDRNDSFSINVNVTKCLKNSLFDSIIDKTEFFDVKQTFLDCDSEGSILGIYLCENDGCIYDSNNPHPVGRVHIFSLPKYIFTPQYDYLIELDGRSKFYLYSMEAREIRKNRYLKNVVTSLYSYQVNGHRYQNPAIVLADLPNYELKFKYKLINYKLYLATNYTPKFYFKKMRTRIIYSAGID